ncbi:MAG: GGDEF domain-containing protein [Burkholderiales bacterium PBB4]|nr:MAG: GGDEF domain-containing protein [Burkholderiales bacterium PBB4]
MDTRTGLVMATFMMLLNGGVLGLMHKSLSPDVQPSASDWRIGTLLFAAGSCLLAAQDFLPMQWSLTIANGCLSLGLALYWRATRRFTGRAETLWLFAPACVTTLGILWFSAYDPHFAARVYFASVGWSLCLFWSAWTLRASSEDRELHSRRVLAAIFVAVGGFMVMRGLSFIAHPVRELTVLDTGNAFNLLTPLVVSALPVIGTSAFLVMCSERLRQQWQRAAATDYLTSLPNRRTITGSGIAAFNRAQRSGASAGLAVAVVDIDHFKHINDRSGHDAGDIALKHVATTLAEHCRGPHMVGRQGGEEFVALFAVTDSAQAHTAAERLRHAVESAPFELDGHRLQLTISVGVAVVELGDTSYDHLLRRADLAVYAAKSGGRNQVAMAAPMAY